MIASMAMGSELSMVRAQKRQAKAFNVQTPDGVRLAAQEWGNLDGPEILFIHGFSQSHLSWSRQFDGELANSFRMITYDIRGHGGSDKPLGAEYYRDYKRWAGEMKSVMEAAKLKKPVLVGWSYGGRIIAEYLMEYGDERIAGINFVAAFTKVVREFLGPATPAILNTSSENLAENIENTRSFLKFSTAQPLPPDEFQVILANNMMVPPQIRGHLLSRPAPYENALKKIKAPVLVSHGAKDQVALFPMARYTAGVVSHAQLSIYKGVGHLPFWEAAPRFNRELAEFVIQANDVDPDRPPNPDADFNAR